MNLERHTADSIIPSRSRFQLRHFVVGQHDTPAMRWRQVLIEAQDLAYKIRSAELDCERKRIEIERLLATGDPLDAIDAEEKQLGIVLTERTLRGAQMELMWLQELAEEIGPHTFDEIEADQPEYWNRRLNRQATVDRVAAHNSVGVGNLQAMLNAGVATLDETVEQITGG